MVSFENFVKSMPPSLLELKVTPSFCFPFKIPDDPTATNKYNLLVQVFEILTANFHKNRKTHVRFTLEANRISILKIRCFWSCHSLWLSYPNFSNSTPDYINFDVGHKAIEDCVHKAEKF